MEEFKSTDLIRVTGVTQRQVQYWDATGLLTSRGPRRRQYTLTDLALGIVIIGLREHASIQKIRGLIDRLRPLLKEDELMNATVVFIPPGSFIVAQGAPRCGLAPGKHTPILFRVGKMLTEALAPIP